MGVLEVTPEVDGDVVVFWLCVHLCRSFRGAGDEHSGWLHVLHHNPTELLLHDRSTELTEAGTQGNGRRGFGSRLFRENDVGNRHLEAQSAPQTVTVTGTDPSDRGFTSTSGLGRRVQVSPAHDLFPECR